MTGRDASNAILKRLLALHPKVIDLSLERLERLLAKLGNPEKKLPPVIHVAGTNGKGSVCAMLLAGLSAAGKRVHLYTSPHLVDFHERIQLAGQKINEQSLADILAECEIANGNEPITFFEITTAAAFLAFSRCDADYVILEVGLGGRLDATNVVTAPALAIITPVSLDHQQYLGTTIREIATEKAGILKTGTTACIVGQQTSEGQEAIERIAYRKCVPLHSAATGCFDVWLEHNTRLVFQNDHGLLDLPRPSLYGAHQIQNAGIVIAALQQLGFTDINVFEAAMLNAHTWPARLQKLDVQCFPALPKESEVWLDGGHNPAAGQAIAMFMAELSERREARLYLVCGMLNTKDVQEFLAPFVGLACYLIGIPVPNEVNALTPKQIQDNALSVGLTATTADTLEDALRQINVHCTNSNIPPRVLICGSLYLAGSVLRHVRETVEI